MVIQQPNSTSLNSITELFWMFFFLELNDRIKIIVHPFTVDTFHNKSIIPSMTRNRIWKSSCVCKDGNKVDTKMSVFSQFNPLTLRDLFCKCTWTAAAWLGCPDSWPGPYFRSSWRRTNPPPYPYPGSFRRGRT